MIDLLNTLFRDRRKVVDEVGEIGLFVAVASVIGGVYWAFGLLGGAVIWGVP